MIYKTFNEAYPLIIKDILENGEESSPRGMKIKEILGYQFTLESIDDPLPLQRSRKLNYKFGVLESLMNLWGQYPKEIIQHYNKNLLNFINEETQQWDGAYPPRIFPVLEKVYNELKRDPDSRRAVVPIYGQIDTERYENSKDIACTLTLQFLIRNGKLNLIASMRSNDILWGTAYDVNQFTTLQRVMACWLGIPTGWYKHQAGSMHAYLERVKQLEKILATEKEEYADFKHPAWDLNFEDTKSEVSRMFYQLNYFLNNGEQDAFSWPLKGNALPVYFDYLTGKLTVKFS